MNMPILEGFFDDSGVESDANAPYVCMAGYVADISYWVPFVMQWQDLLQKHDMKTLHMREFIHLRGDIKDRGWDTQKRDAVLAELIHAIKKSRLVGIGVGIDGVTWKSEIARLKKAAGGKGWWPSPQEMCFFRIMKLFNLRMERDGQNDAVSVVFDSDPQFSPGRLKLFAKIKERDAGARRRFVAITFGDPWAYIPLQAADLLAWETRKALVQKLGGFDDTPRWKELFTALDGVDLDYESELWDRELIETKLAAIERGL
jgi:hypothetical protein